LPQPFDLSRRDFSLLAGGGLFLGSQIAAGQTQHITAQQVVERIRKNVGVPWKAPTRDVFKAGNPDTPVQGIATSVMSTFDVVERAVKAGRNLIITHEPTFWNDQDLTGELTGDAVYLAKTEFIRKHNLVIWRFHDHWHARKPDAMLVGLGEFLGWKNRQADETYRTYNLPSTTLGALAKDIKRRLKDRAVRVIGNPETKISKAAINPGSTSLQVVLKFMPQVDVFVAGEPREWEGPEYVQDAVTAGQQKAMIMIGHEPSEDPGMKLCADWLKTFISEVPVEWIPAADPFWTPA
jgi:putative NIF3 family GTP cyclohydrolase 1 type 2